MNLTTPYMSGNLIRSVDQDSGILGPMFGRDLYSFIFSYGYD